MKLIVKGGKHDGREVDVKGPQFVIGRAEGCQLRPSTETISRKHCVILIDDAGVSIRDLKSRNGVIVNGVKAESQTSLKQGDELRIGSLLFEVAIDYSLGGAKAQKVRDVKDVAAREQAKSARADKVEDADISSWLLEGDEVEQIQKTLVEPDTRQFKLDNTETISAKREDSKEAKPAEAAKEEAKKKEPGKLPARADQTKDSREAAANMLKKFFNRR